MLDLDKVQSDETMGFCLSNFLGYASHAVQDKAIPNFFDGQLPTQRRYILAMQDLKAFPGRKTIKSTVAGARMTGWYSPQGNGYGVLVNMSQDYKVQALLTKPEGNWGEPENFIPAAERYTETQLSKFAMETLLQDLPGERTASDKEPHGIVPTKTNWEGSLLEEEYLPARLPVLLINGSSGIAVGIAQNFQPLEYKSLLNQLKSFIEGGKVDYSKLQPGHPTNCVSITPRSEFEDALKTGSGSIRLAARYTTETDARGTRTTAIIITAVPPYTSFNAIGDNFNAWRRGDTTCPFKAFRNESSNDEIRLVFEFKSNERPKDGAEVQLRLQQLYKKLSLITTATIKMVALKGRYPIQYNVETFFQDWVEERSNIIQRISEQKAIHYGREKHRYDLLKWVRKYVEEVIEIIKTAVSEDYIEMEINKIRNAYNEEILQPGDLKIVLGINLRQLAKITEEELLVKSESMFNKWKTHTDLVNREELRHGRIIKDINYFLKNKDKLGIQNTNTQFDAKLAAILTQPVKEIKVRIPKGENPFIPYLKNKADVDVLCQTESGFFVRISSRGVKTQPMSPKLPMATDKIQHATFVDREYVVFITDTGKLFSILKENLPINQPVHYSKVCEIAKVNQNGVKGISMIPMITETPTHIMLYLEDGTFKKVKMSAVTSMRASITLPTPILYAGFIGKGVIPSFRKGEEIISTVDPKEIRESSPKRKARMPGIMQLGMPTKVLKGLAINRDGRTIFKAKVN